MQKKIIAALAVVFVMFFAMTPAASAAEKITFKEYTDEGKYYFNYPDICTVSWNSTGFDNDDQFVAATCAPGHGFETFEVIYGSGDKSGYTFDNQSLSFPADGNTYKFQVKITPHQVTSAIVSPGYWTNFKVIPQF